jgi:uncharacterized protein (TIGR03000 family)
MYSVVLMMALSGGAAELPAHCHGGCNGGGWGGGCHGGGLFARRSSCCGSHASWGCHGGSGCHGGGWGHGGSGCHGGLFSRHHGCHASSSCCGTVASCGSCGSCGSACGDCGGCAPAAGAMPAAAPAKAPEPIKALPKPTSEEVRFSVPATIVVTLPVEAKLTVDGVATTSTESVRVFTSPALEQNKTFYYTLNGELVRDGQVLKTSQRIAVRAGEETRVELQFPIAVLAQR